MELTLPVAEALALATARRPLPPMIRSVHGSGSTVHAEVDLGLVPEPSLALRLAAAAVGSVAVTAEVEEYADGVLTLRITAHARGLPAHTLLNHVIGPANAALRDAGLPDGLIEVRHGEEGHPLVVVRVQDAVDAQVSGVTVTGIALRDGAVHVTAYVTAVRLR